jgi:hypothetical protein
METMVAFKQLMLLVANLLQGTKEQVSLGKAMMRHLHDNLSVFMIAFLCYMRFASM